MSEELKPESVEQFARDLLTKAIEDGLVDYPMHFAEPHPFYRTAGDLVGVANMLAEWKGRRPPRVWSDEPPTNTGWYWFRDANSDAVILFVDWGEADDDKLFAWGCKEQHGARLKMFRGQWSRVEE